MSDRPRTICPVCEEPIEPDEADVVEAQEKVSTSAMQAPSDEEAGMTRVFHTACFGSGVPGYLRL
jgi:hypothetical protein